jgi:hypothetical protein
MGQGTDIVDTVDLRTGSARMVCMAQNVREKLEKDENRDMSRVPGTFNPGNQAGKRRSGTEGPLGKGLVSNPGKTDTARDKGKQGAPQNQKR